MASRPHQRPDPFQHPLPSLDGEGNGKKGQLSTPFQGLALETRVGARAKFGKYNATFWSLHTLARATNYRLIPHAIEHDDFSLW